MFADHRRAGPSTVPLPSQVDSVSASLLWLDDLARLYRRIGEDYGNRPYQVAGQALTTITQRIHVRGVTDVHPLRSYLTAVAGHLRTRADITRQFAEHDLSLGLDIAATDIAGLAATLTPPQRNTRGSPRPGRSL